MKITNVKLTKISIKSFFVSSLLGLATAWVIVHYILVVCICTGNSMYPTLHARDRLINFKLAYSFNEPKRGDIITFESPTDPGEYYSKRVIGVPGDEIMIVDGLLVINGKAQVEHYVAQNWSDGSEKTYHVPENSVFVMGDNRLESTDSRYFAEVARDTCLLDDGEKTEDDFTYIPYSSIEGKYIAKIWPYIELY